MDECVRTPTEYLESRLREKRAHARQGPPPAFTPVGKDQDVYSFDFDQQNRTVSSSPLSHANSRATSHSRGAQSSRTTASSHTRELGARQAEQQIEKLSKENFDLKLELYHRRNKYNEVEKRLQALENAESDIEQLRAENKKLGADNADLQQINRDATAVIDHQEEAIDEAVVKIIELEDLVRKLQQQQREAGTVPIVKIPVKASQTLGGAREQATPKRTDFSQVEKVDQADESARPSFEAGEIGGVSEKTAEEGTAGEVQVPSFLRSHEPSTSALRSIYMEGDTLIREIPSQASLVTSPSRHDAASYDGSPKSPQFSVLSESDFRSIYGRDTPKPIPAQPEVIDPPSSPESPVFYRKQQKIERTSRWVSDGASSPRPAESDISHATIPSPFLPERNSLAYERGTGISTPLALHAPSPRPAHSSTPRLRSSLSRGAPDLLVPNFGNLHLPPTPDTMPTRQYSQSPSSAVQERSLQDHLDPRESSSHLDRIMRLQKEAEMLARERTSPKDYQTFSDFIERPEIVQDFGAALFRHDDYESDMPPLVPKHQDDFFGLPLPKVRSQSFHQNFDRVDETPLRPSSPTTPRQAPVLDAYIPRSPSPLSEQQRIGKELLRSKTALPRSRSNLQRRSSADFSPPSPPQVVENPPKVRPTSIRFAIPQRPVSWHQAPQEPSSEQAPTEVAAKESTQPASILQNPLSKTTSVIPYFPPSASQASRPSHQRAPSIRERMLKFAHRASISPASASSPHAQSSEVPKQTPESSRRRFFNRRTPSSGPKAPSSRPASRDHEVSGPPPVASDESIRPSHMSAIMAAANAAAPYLSFDINSRAHQIPIVGGLAQGSPAEGSQSAPKPPQHKDVAAEPPARAPYARNMTGRRPRGLSASQWGEEGSTDLTPIRPHRDSNASRNGNRSSILTLSDGTMAGWRPRSKEGWGSGR